MMSYVVACLIVIGIAGVFAEEFLDWRASRRQQRWVDADRQRPDWRY